MHRDLHVVRYVGDRRVDEAAVQAQQRSGIVAALEHLAPIFFVAEHRDEDFVELQVAATGVGERIDRFAVRPAEVDKKGVEVGIDVGVDRWPDRSAVDR